MRSNLLEKKSCLSLSFSRVGPILHPNALLEVLLYFKFLCDYKCHATLFLLFHIPMFYQSYVPKKA
jgi:hypothetical protein